MTAAPTNLRVSRAFSGRVRLGAKSDEHLAARVRDGDDRAFEALYDRHHRALLAFARHLLGDAVEAEDALQHTFAAAYSTLRDGTGDLHLKPWLFAVVRNRCLSVLRTRREGSELDVDAVATEGLSAEVQRRADLRELLADLQRLPEQQRSALVLAELGALSHDEVAEVLGVRREKVKALVFQARESLLQWREARGADCREIREELATLTGGALRRTRLRRHLEVCEGCRAFKQEVRRQRAAMAVALPVIPAVGLKSSILGGVLGGGATVTVGAGGAAAGGGLLTAMQGTAAKVLVVGAVAGGAGTTGYVAVQEIKDSPAAPARTAQPHGATNAPARSAGSAAPTVTIKAGPAATTAGNATTTSGKPVEPGPRTARGQGDERQGPDADRPGRAKAKANPARSLGKSGAAAKKPKKAKPVKARGRRAATKGPKARRAAPKRSRFGAPAPEAASDPTASVKSVKPEKEPVAEPRTLGAPKPAADGG